jgi:hypothetical protein
VTFTGKNVLNTNIFVGIFPVNAFSIACKTTIRQFFGARVSQTRIKPKRNIQVWERKKLPLPSRVSSTAFSQ